jgi:hypothetical protein
MGCDIHIAVERWDGQKWRWTGERVRDDRNYDLFAILADVRNGTGFAGIKIGSALNPISRPRGFPADVDPESVRGSYDEEKGCQRGIPFDEDEEREWGIRADGDHSASYLLLSEILDYDYEQRVLKFGEMTEKDYLDYARTGEIKTYFYSTGNGTYVEVLTEPQYRQLTRGERRRIEGKHYYVRVYWESTYRERIGAWLEALRQQFIHADPTKVRLVFNFDS